MLACRCDNFLNMRVSQPHSQNSESFVRFFSTDLSKYRLRNYGTNDASALLGINPSTLRNRIKNEGLTMEERANFD